MAITAKHLNDKNINVIVAAIAPYENVRFLNKKLIKNYYEIYCKCDHTELVKRDTKDLYLKHNIHLTGVDDPYEEPHDPLIELDTKLHDIDSCIFDILIKLKNVNLINTEIIINGLFKK